MGVSTIVPWRRLDAELLRSVIESFVNREGTDYGAAEFSLADKVAHVKGQLERKEAFIVFDGESESVTIVTAQQARVLRDQLIDEGYDHGEGGLDDGLDDGPEGDGELEP